MTKKKSFQQWQSEAFGQAGSRTDRQTDRLPHYGLGELRAHYTHFKKKTVLDPPPPKKKKIGLR